MDDDGSKSLNWEEFWKGLNDFRIDITEPEAKHLFEKFDANASGCVEFEEFLRSITGEMNPIRKEIVRTAFKKFDADNSGSVSIQDLKGYYSANEHPDVKNGSKTTDEILLEFLDTFDMHHRIRYKTQPDHVVTMEEFIEYYNNISCLINDDEYFDLMINNAWNLKSRNYARGWTHQQY